MCRGDSWRPLPEQRPATFHRGQTATPTRGGGTVQGQHCTEGQLTRGASRRPQEGGTLSPLSPPSPAFQAVSPSREPRSALPVRNLAAPNGTRTGFSGTTHSLGRKGVRPPGGCCESVRPPASGGCGTLPWASAPPRLGRPHARPESAPRALAGSLVAARGLSVPRCSAHSAPRVAPAPWAGTPSRPRSTFVRGRSHWRLRSAGHAAAGRLEGVSGRERAAPPLPPQAPRIPGPRQPAWGAEPAVRAGAAGRPAGSPTVPGGIQQRP